MSAPRDLHRTPSVAGPRSRPLRAQAVLACVLALALLVLGACSSPGLTGSSDSADTAAGPAGGTDTLVEAGAESGDGAGAGARDESGEGADVGGDGSAVLPEGTVAVGDGAPLMVRSVRLEVVVEDVLAAAARARTAATAVEGWVSSEDVRPGVGEEAGWATMVLRVPSADLDAVVTELGELGTVSSSRSSAEDVKSEYRDVEARVATLEASTDRLRDLVREARAVEAIVSLERELADREMELDALKARMQVLAEDVSRSTVTLHLAEDDATLSASTTPSGFLAGLHRGWEAFTTSVTLVLTALGAVLPFLLLAAAVVVPLVLLRRRRPRGTARPARPQGRARGTESPDAG